MCWCRRKKENEEDVSFCWMRKKGSRICFSISPLCSHWPSFFSLFLSFSSTSCMCVYVHKFLRNPFLIPHLSRETRAPVVSSIAYIMASTTRALFVGLLSCCIILSDTCILWRIEERARVHEKERDRKREREKKTTTIRVYVYTIKWLRKFLMKDVGWILIDIWLRQLAIFRSI